MSDIIVGCDTNGGIGDTSWQDTIKKALEDNNHNVKLLDIGPGPFSNYDYYNEDADGKIGVYIMADSLVSVADHEYGGTRFKMAYFVIRGDLGRPKMDSRDDFNKNPIGRDSDCTSVCDKLEGMTYPEMNEKCTRSYCVFGTTPEEGAKELIKAMGGHTSSDEGSSSSTIKDAMREVLYPWNGEAYCYITDDTVNIARIPDPTTAKLKLVEGWNLLDGASLTDINPEVPNKLVVTYGNNTFEIADEERIKRFGEIEHTIESTEKTEADTIDFAYREWNKLLKDSGRRLECKVDGASKWTIGKWVRVYIPSLNLNGYMYIVKSSHDDDGVWDTSLSLADYPPDLGKEPSNNSEDSEEETDSEDSEDSDESNDSDTDENSSTEESSG